MGYTFSAKHIYHLVKNGKLPNLSSHIFPLLGRGKYQKTAKKPTKRQVFCSIDERPVEINQRMRLGDLEVDTIEGQKDDKFNIATTIDCRSRRVATSIYEDKNPEKFAAAIANNICNLNVIPLSITADNGIENHQLKTLKKQFPTIENFYSTHSYAGWEKGTIEQKNKQFRKFRRKGQSMDVLTQSDCDLISLVLIVKHIYKIKKNIV